MKSFRFPRETAVFLGVFFTGLFYLAHTKILFVADAYIFLKYAINLSSGMGWSLNAGETSFGASSPLWTLLLAGYHQLYPQGLAFDRAAAFLGLFLYSAYVYLFSKIVNRILSSGLAAIATAAVAVIPFNGFYLSLSAMETPLFLCFFIASLFFVHESFVQSKLSHAFALGFLFGGLYLVRIEGLAYAASFLFARAIYGQKGSRKFTLIVISIFILSVLPWHYFLYRDEAVFLPTSARGRLYGYLAWVLPEITIDQYQSASILQHLRWMPTIFHTQFLQHPMVLIFCFLPFVFLAASLFIVRVRRFRFMTGACRPMILFLAVGAIANLSLYFFFQPLIFQRYLVAFFPASLVVSGILLNGSGFNRFPSPKLLAAFFGGLLVLTHSFGFSYYMKPIERDYKIVKTLKMFSERTGECRLAAEPLGLAAFFTDCYIVDLGGLINPDIWVFWKEFDRKALGSQGFNRDIEYGLNKKATHLLWNGPLPAMYKNRLKLTSAASSEVSVYEMTGAERLQDIA